MPQTQRYKHKQYSPQHQLNNKDNLIMHNFNIPPSQRKQTPQVTKLELESKPAKYRTDTDYSNSDLNLLAKKLILKSVPAFNEVVTVNNFEFLNHQSNIKLNTKTKKELITSLINLDYMNINKCAAFVDDEWNKATASELATNAFISILLTYGGTSRIITTANSFLNMHSSYVLNESLTDSASTSTSYTKLYFSDNSDDALKASTLRYETLISKAFLVIKNDISNAVASFRATKLEEIAASEQADANRIKLKEMLG